MKVQRVLREVVTWAAFVASGGHIWQVAVTMGNNPVIAGVHAIGLDGLVYIGILAWQAGARVRGALAVIYGGGVSLAFNAASYSAAGTLPVWVMAMSMPVSLVLGVLVSHGVSKDKPVDTPAPVAPVSKPRVRKAAVHVPVTQEMSEDKAPVDIGLLDIPVDNVVDMSTRVHEDKDKRVDKTWDKDKARALMSEGRSDKDIAELVGVSTKTIYRLRTAS